MPADDNPNANYPVAALAALERNPDGVTLSSLSQSVTNRQMSILVRRYAAHMELRGVTPQSTVVIALRSGVASFMMALATGLLASKWVGYHAQLPFRELGTTHFVHGPDKPPNLNLPGSMLFDAGWTSEPIGVQPTAARAFPGFSAATDIAYFTRSSGTTGTVKFMAKTAGQLVDLNRVHDLGKYKVIAPLAPAMASMTFRNIVTSILNGARVVLPEARNSEVGQVADMQRNGVEFVLGSPVQVDAICVGLLPLKQRIKALRVGGAVMDRPAIQHWLGFFEEVILTYGAREGGGGGHCHLREITDDTEIAYTPRGGCEVQVVDEAGQPVPPSVVGILKLRSPTMVTQYVGDATASAEVFRDGWFYPGDLATMTEDGRFTIVGRVKDQFNLGGIKVNAAAVDEAARAIEGVADAVCFTTQGTGVLALSIAVVPTGTAPQGQVAEAIRNACRRVNASLRVQSIYFVKDLPASENGKRVRSAMIQHVAGRPAL